MFIKHHRNVYKSMKFIRHFPLQHRVFVGAPRAQSEYLSADLQADRGGALFKCPIDTTSPSTPNCSEVQLDKTGKKIF